MSTATSNDSMKGFLMNKVACINPMAKQTFLSGISTPELIDLFRIMFCLIQSNSSNNHTQNRYDSLFNSAHTSLLCSIKAT